MKKKLAVFGMITVMAAALLSGCAVKSASQSHIKTMLSDMQKNMEKAESFNTHLHMRMVLGQEGMQEEDYMDFVIDGDIKATAKPERSHATVELSYGVVSQSTESFTTEVETFLEKSGSDYVTYARMGDDWGVSTEDAAAYMPDTDILAGNIKELADNFRLSDELSHVNGEQCFELTGELDEELLLKLMDAESLEELAGLDISAREAGPVSVPCTIDIYKESILPAHIYIDLEDTLNELLEDSGMKASQSFVDLTFEQYDSIGQIEIPEEALEAAGEKGYRQ